MIGGFTGTHRGMSTQQKMAVEKILEACPIHEFHHGDCVGADAEAHTIAKDLNIFTIGHPPSDPKSRAWCSFDKILEPKQYLKRNMDIVKACDLIIAAPSFNVETMRSGTWATIRYARKHKRDIFIVFPDGSVKEERYDSNTNTSRF